MAEGGSADAPNRPVFERAVFEQLFSDCRAEKFAAGKHIFLQDDQSDAVFGLLSGSVEIAIYAIDGQKLVANLQTAPGIVGEIGALDGEPRTATAICRSECMIYTLKRARLLDRLGHDPKLTRSVIELLCNRIRWATRSLGDQAFLQIEGRLAKRLLLLHDVLADREGWIAISQSEIAEFLGATRESVNKLLNDWRSGGLIDAKRGRLKIANLARLRTLASNGAA